MPIGSQGVRNRVENDCDARLLKENCRLHLCSSDVDIVDRLWLEDGMKLIFAAAFALAATGAQAQYFGTGSNPNTHTSSGYTTSRGTTVQPYVATNPNSTQRDNFSASGNINPYTGAVGTRTPRY